MKILLATALAAAAVSATPAVADTTAAGRYCGMSQGLNVGGHTGDLESGPVVAADLTDVTNPVSVTVICDIQVNGTGAYSDPDAVHETATGTAVAMIEPRRNWDLALDDDDVLYLCTTWEVTDAAGNITRYYRNRGSEEGMSKDPNAVRCRGPL
jgi:hypothetical protein